MKAEYSNLQAEAPSDFDIDGRQYWTMGAPIEETIIINRAWLDWQERLARGEGAESGTGVTQARA